MWSWINAVVDLVAQYPAWALIVAFLAAIIEAVAVLGILIPGTPILMAVAGAAAMSGQPMLPFLTLSIIGAVIGDFLSFWVGKRFSFRLKGLWPFLPAPPADGKCGPLLRPLWHLQRRALPVRARYCARRFRWSPGWQACGRSASSSPMSHPHSCGRPPIFIPPNSPACRWTGYETATGSPGPSGVPCSGRMRRRLGASPGDYNPHPLTVHPLPSAASSRDISQSPRIMPGRQQAPAQPPCAMLISLPATPWVFT